MIKNDFDYKEAKERLKEFQQCCSGADRVVSIDVDPETRRTQIEFAKAKSRDWQEQIEEYERLLSGDTSNLPDLSSIIALPAALVKWRIARGLSVGALADRAGVDWEQLERHELNDFEEAPFKLILKLCYAMMDE